MSKDIQINEKQFLNIRHALGLGQGRRKNKPYRNYYNSGRERSESWDDLVRKNLAEHREVSTEMGGNYYHISDDGLSFVIANNILFGLDLRIKKVETLSKMVNE